MVTTISTSEEAKELFAAAQAKTYEAIQATELLETEIADIATRLIVRALETVTPALKLVDQFLTTSGIRGVRLRGWHGPDLILMRDGRVLLRRGSEPILPQDVVWYSPRPDDEAHLNTFIGYTIDLLQELAEVYERAMNKNQSRHQSMDEMRTKLNRAATAFDRV